ncbi:hypothetical protein L4C32_09350 [Aliivibrio kagoshimensis]
MIGRDYYILHQEKINIQSGEPLSTVSSPLINALILLKKKWPLRVGRVSLIVPDSYVSCRPIHINGFIRETEKYSRVLHVFNQQSDFPIDDLYVDIVERSHRESKQQEFTVYALKKEVVRDFLKAVKQARFIPVLLDFHSNAFLTIWREIARRSNKKSGWMLVELHVDRLKVGLYCPDNGEYYRDCSITMGDSPQVLNEQIQRQIQLYLASKSTHRLEGIWLLGGNKVIAAWLTETVQLPVETVELPHSHHDDFTLAIGAAISGKRWLELEDSYDGT